MIINLNHTLFRIDPDIRFCKQFKLPEKTWDGNGRNSIWYKYKWLYYDCPEIQEYIEFKYKKSIHRNTLMRWFNRTEVYNMAQKYTNRGVQKIHIEEFGPYTDFIRSELKMK